MQTANIEFISPRRQRRAQNFSQDMDYYQLSVNSKPNQKDRYKFVFINLVLQGFSIALPYNLIIISDRFRKFLLDTGDCQTSHDCSVPWISSLTGILMMSFSLKLLTALPSSFFPVRWFSLRVSGSLIMLVVTSLTMILCLLASLGPELLFPCLLLLSVFTGLYLSSLVGMVARLPSHYSVTVFIGMNVSGVFVCLMESLLVSLMPDPSVGEVRLVSVYYLILIMAAYLVSFDLLYALPCCDYYQHYVHKCKPKIDTKSTNNLVNTLVLYISYVITFTIFPTVFKDIRPLSSEMLKTGQIFTITTCYLNFYTSSIIGQFAAIFSYLPFSWLPSVMTAVRLCLLGVFLVSNYVPSDSPRTLEVMVHWDWTLAVTVTVFSLLGGFVTHQLRAFALASTSSQSERSVVSMRMALTAILGAASGIALSQTLPIIVSSF